MKPIAQSCFTKNKIAMQFINILMFRDELVYVRYYLSYFVCIGRPIFQKSYNYVIRVKSLGLKSYI